MDRETRKYWQSQRRQMLNRDRRQRLATGQAMIVTKVLIGLMILALILESVPGVMATLTAPPGGVVVSLLLAALSPGGLLGLLFSGVFLWIIGSQLEGMIRWWQYLLIFFASGILGAIVPMLMGSGLVAGTFASFGLAGAYVMAMANRRVSGAAQWALLLIAINVVLSGFNPGMLAGMLTAFFVGLLTARLVRI